MIVLIQMRSINRILSREGHHKTVNATHRGAPHFRDIKSDDNPCPRMYSISHLTVYCLPGVVDDADKMRFLMRVELTLTVARRYAFYASEVLILLFL